MSDFKVGQEVRVVKGYQGVPNLFAGGFEPTEGMVGSVDELPQEPGELVDESGVDIPPQYVIDFGNGRWDTFTPDELEAV